MIPNPFKKSPGRQALFICGCGHSGTTLVANMFAAHPEVFVPLRETNVFRKPLKARFKFRALLDELKASGKPYLVEKTPRHVLALDLIRRLAPGARFLLLVRDGRDVAASLAKRHGSVEEGVARWTEENLVVERERHARDVMVLRYEDLIEDPRGMLEEVCEFAGIPFADEMLSYHDRETSWFGQAAVGKSDAPAKGHLALRNWQVNQPIFDGRGQWKDILLDEDLAHFANGTARRLMEAFGYDVDESGSLASTATASRAARALAKAN